MKNPAGVNQPATTTSQYSLNPNSEPHVVLGGNRTTLYQPAKGGLMIKKGPNTDKTQFSNN